MTMTQEQAHLVDRLRALLAAEPSTRDMSTREVSMFGGRSIMLNDKLVVCALKRGDLLVRVPPERHRELIARPGAAQAEMGAGRDMGPSWITIDAGTLGDDDALAFWLDVAVEHNRATTGTHP